MNKSFYDQPPANVLQTKSGQIMHILNEHNTNITKPRIKIKFQSNNSLNKIKKIKNNKSVIQSTNKNPRKSHIRSCMSI